MLHITYHILLGGILLLLSPIALSTAVSDKGASKIAACNNAPKSSDQSDSREINIQDTVSNLRFTTVRPMSSKDKSRNQSRGQGSQVGGSQ